MATVGPAVFSEEKLRALVYAGVNGFRFNFSHGSYDERDAQIKMVRQFAAERGKTVALMQDLQGPKMRLGDLKDKQKPVRAGQSLILDYAIKEHDGGDILPVQYNLAEKVKVGEPVFLFDGKIATKVEEIISKTAIKVRVENDGMLMSRKGVNLPDTDLGGDVITEKDLADIEFGAARDFDYVAMSFVQTAEDVRRLRQLMVAHGSSAKIVAKIETKKAIETATNLEEIVKAADGVMIARGDMAIEAGAEVVPIVERDLINLCRKHSKLCIVATQMMASMVDNPQPTRAEVSDVATAVILGADAVMLSDETANGKYPLETVKAMKEVILYTQAHSKMKPLSGEIEKEEYNYDAIARAAVNLAEKIEADLIICATKSGATAWSVAAQRPNLPILSVTSNPRVAGQLALLYANSSFVREFSDNYAIDLAQELKASGYLRPEKDQTELLAVVISGLRDKEGGTNSIQIKRI